MLPQDFSPMNVFSSSNNNVLHQNFLHQLGNLYTSSARTARTFFHLCVRCTGIPGIYISGAHLCKLLFNLNIIRIILFWTELLRWRRLEIMTRHNYQIDPLV